MNKIIFITGCSSGIGRMTAKYFNEKGWNVVATVRKFSENDKELTDAGMFVVQLDVTKEDTIKDAISKSIDKYGKIDVLLNNAGYGSYGILEATPEKAIRMQFDVNVIGALMVTKNVIPHMRRAGEGIIINISSMGGKITFPMGTLYHGSKFAVEGMSEALSFELEAIGIKVKLVEPGAIKTNFASTVFESFNIDPSQTEYTPFIEKVTKAFQTADDNSSEPILVAETIFRAATDGTNQMRYVAGPDAEQLINARKQMNDNDYMNMMKQSMGLI